MRDLGILVVDNSREVLDVIERMFRYFKVKVSSCTCAYSALESLRNSYYKTMIIDVDMQDIVGLELASMAHEINPDLNIVLFVGDSHEKIMKLSLEPKVSDITASPLKPYSLNNMLLDIKFRETGKIFLLE